MRERNKDDIKFIEFDEFKGYQTKYHRSHKKARGYLVNNSRSVEVLPDGSITPRLGYQILGAGSAATTPIKTLMKFKPRSNPEIILRTYGTVVEYYSTHSSKWETLLTGLTSGLVFGWQQMDYAPFAGTENDPTDYTFQQTLFFGNKTDAARSWNGATAKILSTTVNTITIDGGVNIASLDPAFKTSGSIVINGTTYTYSGISTTSFTGVGTDPRGEVVGSSIAQATTDESSTMPNGNIYYQTDNARLLMAGNVVGGVYVSKTNNPRDFTFSATRVATDGAVINVGTQVKSFEQLADKIYHLGPEKIGYLQFSQIGNYASGYDFITIRPEVEGYDVGPTNELASAKWDNKVIYASQHAIKDLGSVIQHYTFQVDHISELMKPTFEDADLSSAALAVYRDKLFVACKQTSLSNQNDIVFVYDIIDGQWEAPRLNNVSCWVVANGNLYAGNAINPTVWQMEVLGQHLDGDSDGSSAVNYSISPVAELWQENFELPFERKTLYSCFLEGEINEGSTLNGEILLDEDGYSGTLQFSITGTQSGIIFKSTSVNTFSLQTFATSTFASDENATLLNFFRVIFEPRSTSHFYVVSIKLSSQNSTDVNDNWKVKRIGWKVDKWNSEDSSIKIS